MFGRALVDMLEREKLVQQPIRVTNKSTGASAEAMAYLAAQRGDDHTIAIFTNTWLATPLTRKNPAHTLRDFTPIARLVLEPMIAAVRADSPYRNLAEFIAAAKKNPGALKQGGGSITAIDGLTGLLLQSVTGAKWSFESTPAVKDRMLDLLAGKVDIVMPQPQDANEHIVSGKMRAIAAITERRLASLPDVPTTREQGIAIPIIGNVRGIVAPAALSWDTSTYWQELFARLGATPSWRRYVAENQVQDVFLRGPELAPYLEEQAGLMRKVLREAGMQ
ncbi:MAG TPA: tripartite tricarboxylate transporter substrate binding protein [Burkholderiales bacterium]|nr:tripartite tricarboxylate transporter substrate binding protein [Burkholderiales bacterium]